MAVGHSPEKLPKPTEHPYVREAKQLYTTLILLGRNLLASKVLECGRAYHRHECIDCLAYTDVALSCDQRLCPRCARRRSARFLDRHHTAISQIQHPSLLTLTFKSVHHLTKASISASVKSFARLRQQKLWRSNVTGGLAGLELTYTENGWHPHYHALIDNTYIPVVLLSRAWWKASRGSYIVDIRRADTTSAVYEVAKYIAKGSSFYKESFLLEQFMLATKGRRFYTTFGSLYRAIDEPVSQNVIPVLENSLPAVDNPYYPRAIIHHCSSCGSKHVKSLGKVLRNPITPPPVQVPF